MNKMIAILFIEDNTYSEHMESHVRKRTDDVDVEDNLGICHDCDTRPGSMAERRTGEMSDTGESKDQLPSMDIYHGALESTKRPYMALRKGSSTLVKNSRGLKREIDRIVSQSHSELPPDGRGTLSILASFHL